jgi:hypothetical protein
LADEETALAADEQKKIDIKIRALQQCDALKSKAPTYGTDASAQAELAGIRARSPHFKCRNKPLQSRLTTGRRKLSTMPKLNPSLNR